ncbi:hypothetical protein ABMA28_012094 [Loxostege sticticalis]|uniref:Lipocalin/cytosolic fatty-acid binding domain-containing protein n=1 Tax=Loxostege sticticalis TaxID=481309 RepID=A0ABD0TLL4_LOXSC
MATAQIVLLIEVLYFFEIFASGNSSRNASKIPCPYFRKTFPPLNVQGLVGNWRPIKAESHVTMICFNLNIRATTELEREQYVIKYGNFNGRVNWSTCFLEVVESPLGKHFLQGNGSEAGVLENIIVSRDENGTYILLDQGADQWQVVGRRGVVEMIEMQDCMSMVSVSLLREPSWPEVSWPARSLFSYLNQFKYKIINYLKSIKCKNFRNYMLQTRDTYDFWPKSDDD